MNGWRQGVADLCNVIQLCIHPLFPIPCVWLHSMAECTVGEHTVAPVGKAEGETATRCERRPY